MEAEKRPIVAVLFARTDSIYKQDQRCDVFDIERDARTFAANMPVVAHPPCRAWGRLRAFAKPREDEPALAIFAADIVRQVGGVLEHPAHSTLWPARSLPQPGQRDQWGGWTLPILQSAFGHRADKPTWLYIVGIEPARCPPFPLSLHYAERVISTKLRGDKRKEVTHAEREATPPALASWLVDLASQCGR